jgi:hypothetical protein
MEKNMLLAAAAAFALAPGAALAGLPLEVPEPASLALVAAPAAALLLARRRRARRGLSASPPPAAPAREAR